MTDRTTVPPGMAAAPNDDALKAYEVEFDACGMDREKLEAFQVRLGHAILATAASQRENYWVLKGQVIERLKQIDRLPIAGVSPPQTSAQETLSNNSRYSPSELLPSAAIARNHCQTNKRSRVAADEERDEFPLTEATSPDLETSPALETSPDLEMGVVSSSAKMDGEEEDGGDENYVNDGEDDDDDDDDDLLNYFLECTGEEIVEELDDDEEIVEELDDDPDPIIKQKNRAIQQLELSAVRILERLVRAKHQIEILDDQAMPTTRMKDIQDAMAEGLCIAELKAEIDEAITNIHQQAASDEANESPSETDIQPPQVKDLSLKEIRATISESHLLPTISDSLANHHVEPFFHTLLFPQTFLNNCRSGTAVTSGVADEGPPFAFEPDGGNLNEAVKEGIGAKSIFDRDLNSTWLFEQGPTAFAVELVNTAAVMLGEGIECTNFSPYELLITNRGMSSNSLLTRHESRGVVANAFHRIAVADEGWVTAITGSPGIGKSWTLIYALQQALLYDGATVLLFLQKKNRALLYLRRNNKIYAWTAPKEGSAFSVLFRRPDVLILLDPKEAIRIGADFSFETTLNLIYAASNNAVHFKFAQKDFDEIQAILGPPLDPELFVILKHLKGPAQQLEREVIMERKAKVGNLFRYIANEKQFRLRETETDEAVNKCTGNAEILAAAIKKKGMSDNRMTIPGTLFEVLPRRPWRLNKIGYDGQNVEYHVQHFRAINNAVRDKIVTANREVILSYWNKVSEGESSQMGAAVENLFIQDLFRPEGMMVERHLQCNKKAMMTSDVLNIFGPMTLLHDVPLAKVCDDVLNKNDVVARLAAGSALIDAAGPGRKVYQVTVSPQHKMSLKSMKELGTNLGFIEPNGVVDDGAIEKLEFYWVVPEGRAAQWKQKRPFQYKKGTRKQRHKDLEIVNEFLRKHVIFYVLPLTIENPKPGMKVS